MTGRCSKLLASTHPSLDGKRYPRRPNPPLPISCLSGLGPFSSVLLCKVYKILDRNKMSQIDIASCLDSNDPRLFPPASDNPKYRPCISFHRHGNSASGDPAAGMPPTRAACPTMVEASLEVPSYQPPLSIHSSCNILQLHFAGLGPPLTSHSQHPRL